MTDSFTATVILPIRTLAGERPEERFDSWPLPGQMRLKPWVRRERRFRPHPAVTQQPRFLAQN
jgi:hypothetical protein